MTLVNLAGVRTLVIASVVLQLSCAAAARRDREVEALLHIMDAPSEEAAPAAIWKQTPLFDPSSVTTERKDAPAQLWRRLRAAHPLTMQGVAVSKMRPDGTCSVVITEPPPHVGLAQLGRYVDGASVMQTPIGHDGALFDAVGTLSGGRDEIVRKLSALNLILFRTEHGAFVYEEPFERDWKDAREYALDLQVSAEELRAWATNPSTRFEAVRSGEQLDAAAVAAAPNSAVYRLLDAHLIGWWIPRRAAISGLVREIREFAVESDVIVGALSQPSGLMVFARERTTPYEFLPPLRAETVALLAAVRGKPELVQSFQRNLPGAGPYSRKWDWAPILLSPELVDTEYGELLNEADQMLKAWSQRGLVEYEGFNYDQPDNWPFAGSVARLLLGELDEMSLNYNWNTAGAGYVVTAGDAAVYALHRTGGLPIAYIPGDDTRYATTAAPYEDAAYSWFAELNNPVLVRVAQYAALFQIFHALGSEVEEQEPPADVATDAYGATMREFWAALYALTPVTLKSIASTMGYQQRVEASVLQAYPKWLSAWLQPALQRDSRDCMFKELSRQLAAWRELDPVQRARLEAASSVLDPRELTPSQRETIADAQLLLSAVAAHTGIVERYVALRGPRGDGWTHTASVVLSSAAAAAPLSIGGHNVGASTLQLKVGESTPRGRPRWTREGIEINAADVGRSRDLVRTLARGPDDTDLDAQLVRAFAAATSTSPRTPALALRVHAQSNAVSLPPARRFVDSRALPAVVDEAQTTLPGNHVLAFVRDRDHVWVVGPNRAAPIVTSSLADASELAALRIGTARGLAGRRGQDLALEFHGMGPAERKAVVDRLHGQARGLGYSEDIVAVVRSEQGSVRRLSARDYDFARPTISVGKVTERVAKVTVTLQPRRLGLRAAVIEVWVRVKGALTDLQLASVVRAIERRAHQVLRRLQADSVASHRDAALILHEEISRVKRLYDIEIETRAREAAGDVQLTALVRSYSSTGPVRMHQTDEALSFQSSSKRAISIDWFRASKLR
jgi:hypothetical protein